LLTNQSNNNALGDIVAGNKHVIQHIKGAPTVSGELLRLYGRLQEDGIGEQSNGIIIEQLQHYLSARTDGDVRGLEDKLKTSGRKDLLDFASLLKEKATKKMMRYQHSRTAQRIFTIILEQIHTSFVLTIVPRIQNEESRLTVDQSTHVMLDDEIGKLGENLLELTSHDLLGLLYFLAGNCHIRWDKC
jgi:hypothetical protein